MGLIDVHLHEPDLDWNFNFGSREEHTHEADDAESPATPDSSRSSGPNALALVGAFVAFALVATVVAVVAKKKLGGSTGDLEEFDELDVQ